MRRRRLKAEVGAWRVKGADTGAAAAGLQDRGASFEHDAADHGRTRRVAGREVTRIGDPGQLTHGPLYVVVRGDTLLFVQTPEPALAEEAMGKLPAIGSRLHQSSALTMKPASTSSVAEVT